jgi:hypothetical protein
MKLGATRLGGLQPREVVGEQERRSLVFYLERLTVMDEDVSAVCTVNDDPGPVRVIYN